MRIQIIIFLGILFMSNVQIKAQNFDPDEEFATARNLAFDGKKDDAEKMLNVILEKYPNYSDVRLFLATVYGWNEKYKLARKEFQILINKEDQKKDYWIGYVKNEIWAEQALKAIEISKEALGLYPNDVDFIILKASAERNNNEMQKAARTIKDFLTLNPDNKEAIKFSDSLKDLMATNTISINVSRDYFTEIYGQMHYYNIQYTKDTKFGSIVGRYNINKKFDTYGSQIEFDAYPSISNGMYAYLNVGFSQSPIFPGFRCGAQIYRSLPASLEASLGFRALKFGDNLVKIYTGSVGKYFGNSFVFFVPYVIPGKEGTSKSGNITYRKYAANEDQYFGITLGLGFSPEINRFGLNSELQPIVSLRSQKIDIVNNFRVKNNKNVIGIGLSLAHQESIFNPGKYFWITSVSLAYSLSY